MHAAIPRIVLAGSAGDSGKTMLTIGLLAHWRRLGRNVVGFKKGPDFIDAAWLTQAASNPARNLDVYLTGEENVYRSFCRFGREADFCAVEGNRGVFDGMDAKGTFSTAELAKLLRAPVILVLDATKITRTLAAFVLGCTRLDPEVNFAGVVLNRIAGARHQRTITQAIEQYAGVPVVGAIPKLKQVHLLPERHLGLVTPEEHYGAEKTCETLAAVVSEYVDVGKIEEIARSAPVLDCPEEQQPTGTPVAASVRIGIIRDSAFTFYYPENLEKLQRAGARFVPISALDDNVLPDIDGLYIGGGFPETHADQLARNRSLLREIRAAAESGLPIYAECGGLVLLGESLEYGNERYQMAGVFPFRFVMRSKPVGHGYCEFEVDERNPFFEPGTRLRGHEFHYSTISSEIDPVKTVYRVLRGKGYGSNREGFLYKNVLGTYFHLHGNAAPGWAENFIRVAHEFKNHKVKSSLV